MTPSQMWIGRDCGPQTRPIANTLLSHLWFSSVRTTEKNYAKTWGEGNIPPSSPHFLTDQQNPHASFTLAKNLLTPNSIWLQCLQCEKPPLAFVSGSVDSAGVHQLSSDLNMMLRHAIICSISSAMLGRMLKFWWVNNMITSLASMLISTVPDWVVTCLWNTRTTKTRQKAN